MRFYDNRLQVWVYCPIGVDLNYASLLTYSTLAYKDRYGQQPSINRVAWSTGLSHDAVKASLDRLSLVGLYSGGKPRYLPDTFIEFPTSGHWSQGMSYWRCLVREQNSLLSVPDIMAYSYLACKIIDGYTPARGWSHAYLGSVLCVDERTAARSLDRLEEIGLFRQGPHWQVAEALNGEQLEWVKEKGASTTAVEASFFTPPERKQTLLRGDMLHRAIESYTHDSDIQDKIFEACKAQIVADGKLKEDWRAIVKREALSSVVAKRVVADTDWPDTGGE